MPWPLNYGYCTSEQLRAILPTQAAWSALQGNDGDTILQNRIKDAAVEIDATLAPYYATPVTGASALALMQLVNMRMAAAELYHIYTSASDDTGKTRGVEFKTWAHLILADIIDGHIRLFDAVAAVNNPQFPPGAGATFNPDDDADLDADAVPLFHRGDRDTFTGNMM